MNVKDEPDEVRYVQLYNPITERWVKWDRRIGKIAAHKKTPGPYKSIPKYRDVMGHLPPIK
jgi:hypothetical protein